ncbi:transglutaminaseTgpA domain-containing protein [Halomontanus rarus]|uniref:transglutaminaseTgpA domain-containing protein n=1 Tax=Halomontanus rarus TaxID=3034020 RepID=UPI001A9A1E4E
MSTKTGDRSRTISVDGQAETGLSPKTFRLLALGGVGVLTASYISVLQNVTAVVGGTQQLFTLVILMLAGATVLAHTITPRTATLVSIAAGALGFAYYLTATGLGVGVVFSATDKLISDTIALATGLSLLQMMEAGIWTLGFAPGPVFLSWYLVLRGRYTLSVIPGGVALLFLVLTGDAAILPTLLGAMGAIAAVGFGELEHYRGTIMQADILAILFAAMIVLSLSVTLVPGGTSAPTFLVESSHDGTLEGSISSAPDRTTIAGDVDLSPEVRFTVRSDEESYWRTGVYDRFTGDGWVRTGQAEAYSGPIAPPPGETETIRQTVFAEDTLDVMPTASHPVDIEGDIRENTELTTHGQFRPDEPLIEGDVYNVESAVINASVDELSDAGTDYPDSVENRYLQRTEGTSSEFEARTAEITADADTPYEAAVAIERHLRSSKDYSLNVSRPEGNVAEEFLLEMDEGYCVYFATTMTQMLRAEEIPARYVTGYTSGQQVDDNEWVVRGLNAHTWVEVYFPDHGWVAFEPTPSDSRDSVHNERLEEARADGEENVDTDRSEDVPVTETEVEPTESDDPAFDGPDGSETENGTESNVTNGPNSGGPGPDDGIPEQYRPTDPRTGPGFEQNLSTPTDLETEAAENETDDDAPPFAPENAALGIAILIGLAAGAHRTGATRRVGREARLQWHGFQRSPEADTERAYRRLEMLLERRYRSRRPGESMRQYLDSLSRMGYSSDDRIERVGRLYERSTYGNGVSREEADDAVALVDAMAREELPLIGRFWR